MSSHLTHYETLGVSPGADLDAIKRTYRKLAQLYHPDVNPDPAAAEKLKGINDAYEVLSDNGKRREYDAELRLGAYPTAPVRSVPDSGDAAAADALLAAHAQELLRQWNAEQHAEQLRRNLIEEAAAPQAPTEQQLKSRIRRLDVQRYTTAVTVGVAFYLLRSLDMLSPLGTTVVTERVVSIMSGFNWLLLIISVTLTVLGEKYSEFGYRLAMIRPGVARNLIAAAVITVVLVGEYLSTTGGLVAFAAVTVTLTLAITGGARYLPRLRTVARHLGNTRSGQARRQPM